MESTTEKPLEFQWGKGGPRSKNPLVKFYRSFRFDGTDYALHDCVYMYKDGVLVPYIGKLVKIWEHKKARKVKVQWFFTPDEIAYYLKDQKVLENEVFFASGKGVGAANVNPLEAIAGKCNVICISKDCRNPQPSNEELSEADYVFYRTFNVDSLSISDKWGDHVGELEVKFIFNRMNEISNNMGLSHGLIDDRNGVGGRVRCADLDSSMGLPVSVDMDAKVENHMKGPADLEVRPAKRMKLELRNDESKERNPVSLEGKATNGSSKESLVLSKDLQLNSKSNAMDAVVSKKRKADEELEVGKTKFTKKFGSDSRSYAPSKSSNNLESSIDRPKKLIVTRRPNVETNSWFKDLPWEQKVPTAQEDGTLILLQNLDPEFTSGEVEDIIWHAFGQRCSAKMVQHTSISSPFSGQALVILKSKEVTERVLKRLSEALLMLPNGRPLVGSLARLPKVSQNPVNFVGHLSIDKIKHKTQKETEAVSTSHYSQPNTVEFEMAMDWFLLQARSTIWWEKLYKKQTDEIEKVKAKLKSNSRSSAG